MFTRFKSLLNEPKEYLDKKIEDYAYSGGLMFTIFLSAGVCLWSWDWVVDPARAMETLPGRLFFLTGLILLPIYRRVRKRAVLVLIYVIACFFVGEATLVRIFATLDNGLNYGTGGFLYFVFLSPLTLRCFSFRTGFILTMLTALFPMLFAAVADIEGFRYLYYAVFIGPGAGAAVMVQLVLAFSDRSLYETEKALEKASSTDPLTGIANRRSFIEILDNQIIRSRRYTTPLSLLMLDLDRFKKINDTYGHPAGDAALKHFTKICLETIRDVDIAGRWGGEEFVILLPMTGEKESVIVAERIRTALEAVNVASPTGDFFPLTVSIGAGSLEAADTSCDDFISRVDDALYAAKEAGRNRVEFAGNTA